MFSAISSEKNGMNKAGIRGSVPLVPVMVSLVLLARNQLPLTALLSGSRTMSLLMGVPP